MTSIAYALLVGVLFGVAVTLLLRRSIIDHVFGLILLSHAANLIVFGGGGLTRGAAPLLDGSSAELADPLPQAMVLTAIVISFGVIAFATVLIARLHASLGSEDVDALRRPRP